MSYFKHVGVLGMHWGHRKAESSSGSVSSHPDHTTSRLLKKKKLHEMSNEEIRKVTTRLQLEKSYRELSPPKVAKGKKAVLKYLGMSGGTFASTVAAGVGAAAGAYVLKKILEKTPFKDAVKT